MKPILSYWTFLTPTFTQQIPFLKLLIFTKYSVEILNVFTVFQENGLIIFLLILGGFAIIFASVAL